MGIKSRETYEVAGSLSLIMAHRELEDLTLTRELQHFKTGIDQRMTELIYEGLWFSPLADALRAFIDETQKYVTGDVRLRYFKGSLQPGGTALTELALHHQAGHLRSRRHLQPRIGQGLHPAVGSAARGVGPQAPGRALSEAPTGNGSDTDAGAGRRYRQAVGRPVRRRPGPAVRASERLHPVRSCACALRYPGVAGARPHAGDDRRADRARSGTRSSRVWQPIAGEVERGHASAGRSRTRTSTWPSSGGLTELVGPVGGQDAHGTEPERPGGPRPAAVPAARGLRTPGADTAA